ncbi:hypothetical protein E4582_10720 [Luteimonas yindakuii]|uniref:Adhesin n=1 Tax=Luteimonas yindakuii TaxID=2565782 RepID=A0A4Z1R6V2_9GAMM|nr:hypothetical protein [Luteimonas yindakuii]QCO68658.1 hypothetical protein E5843_00455 [Luteimonas yindakuii]TKS55404.1 hypothetical protein E4582_10720 [Luteimonas yindakuii]
MPHLAAADEYTAMLGYLAESRIEERAFAGAQGAMAINQAAGDHNLQANLHSFAEGDRAHASATARQYSNDFHTRGSRPDEARAVIGGDAFRGAGGLVSINQASGAANAELNVVTATLANQGIREAGDAWLASADYASAGQRAPTPQDDSDPAKRHVAVERTALQGFEGVLQLNQIAGAGNTTDNALVISVQAGP